MNIDIPKELLRQFEQSDLTSKLFMAPVATGNKYVLETGDLELDDAMKDNLRSQIKSAIDAKKHILLDNNMRLHRVNEYDNGYFVCKQYANADICSLIKIEWESSDIVILPKNIQYRKL